MDVLHALVLARAKKREERGFHRRQQGRGGSARWSYLFCFPLVSWHHGPTPLSTYVVLVNKRENCTRSGRQLGPSSSSSICVFEVWALQSFSMFSPDINFSPLNNNGNIAAAINWAGCGPSSPGQISSPDINFSSWKWPAHLYFFFKNTQARSSCYSPPHWATNLS